jgi:putative membrane protein
MNLIVKVLIAIVAIEHLYILWLEMFAWTTAGKRTFKSMSADMFEKTKAMAANQGLYNGFLSAGLIWSLFIIDVFWAQNVATFFLGCVIVAGLYGAATVQRSILFVQALPAALALAAVLIL